MTELRLSAPEPKGEITKEEFCARFKAYMLSVAGPIFDDGDSVAEYAEMAAAAYWEDEECRKDGPEESASADISYWGD